MAGHSYANRQNVLRCEYPLRDGNPCQSPQRLNGRCEHHAAIEIGALNGYGVSGSRKAGVYKAERHERKLFASSAREMYELLARKCSRPAPSSTSSRAPVAKKVA